MYPDGCRAFRHISPNIEREESSIKDDRETTISDELTFTEVNAKYSTILTCWDKGLNLKGIQTEIELQE
jgi:hypothetical protein